MAVPDSEALLEHRAFMVAIARALLQDEQRAEDVAQEGLLAFWRRPPRTPRVRGWLRSVTRNLVAAGRRADGRRARRERAAARREPVRDSTEQVARLELQQRIVAMVLELPEPGRSTIVARYLEDRSIDEISAAHGVSPNTVKTRLRRSLARLRARLDAGDADRERSWVALLQPMAAVATAGSAFTGGLSGGALVMGFKAKMIAAVLLAGAALLLWSGLRSPEQRGTRREPHRWEAGDANAASALEPARVSPSSAPAAERAAIDRRFDLHGIVRDAGGAPVAGAELEVVHCEWQRTDILAPRELSRAGARTHSASDGTFRLRLRPGALVNLRIRAAGHAPVELRELQAGERVEVVLRGSARLSVEVRDWRGERVGSARVRLVRHEDGIAVDRVARTDARGVAWFDDLAPGVSVTVIASHPDHGALVDDPEAEAPAALVVELPRGREVRGRVLDAATREPIAAARVGVNRFMDPETVSDEHGRFRINGHVGASYFHAVRVEAAGYAPASHPVRGGRELIVALDRAARCTGRVVDRHGRPVANARIAALSMPGPGRAPESAYATAGPDGRFTLAPLARGARYALSVAAGGHGRSARILGPLSETGAHDMGDVVLPAMRTIAGVVVDESGAGVPRCRITLQGSVTVSGRTRYLRGMRDSRRTDDLGRFRFSGLADGDHTLQVVRDGAADTRRRISLAGADASAIVLRLASTRPFTVRVESDRGEPVASAELILDDETGSSRAFTDESGVARFQAQGRIRRVRIWTIYEGNGGRTEEYGDVEPLRDIPADRTEARIVVPVWVPLAGVVRMAGKPFPGAILRVTWPGGDKEASTGSNGRFRTVVPPGVVATVRVTGRRHPLADGGSVHDPSFQGPAVKVPAGRTDAVLSVREAERNRELTVVVRDPEGDPVAGAIVGYGPRSPLHRDASWSTDARGVARLSGLPARTLTIYAQLAEEGPHVHPAPVELLPAGQSITLVFRTAFVVGGRVVRRDGEPAAGAELEIGVGGEDWWRECDEDGRFEFRAPRDAAAVRIRAVWSDADGKRHIAVVTTPPAAGRNLRIRLSAE